MPIGINDLKNVLRLPGNWDLSYLARYRLNDGTTFDQVVTQIGAALVLFNRSLTSGYWSQYLTTTTDLTTEYDIGGDSNELKRLTDKGRPDPIYRDGTGHMLPMHDYGGALAWTYLSLRRARMVNLNRDIRGLIERGQNSWEKRIHERLFKSTADTVGSTGKSVPFADGGTADSAYVPPTYEGKAFASSHNHFLRYAADAAGRTAALKAMAGTLREHGFASPFELIVSEADKATWAAQTEFKKPERGVLSTAGVEVRAQISEETYIGIIETDDAWFRVKTTPRLPTAYAGAFKPFGFGSPDNPLAVRYEDGFPLGLSLVAQILNFPLQDAVAMMTFGVGVANRLAGTATYFAANGDYTSPTIS